MRATYARRNDVGRLPAGTETVHGRIPHLRVVTSYGLVDAPVAVEILAVDPNQWPYIRLRPKMDASGRYLHVLPGGELIAGAQT